MLTVLPRLLGANDYNDCNSDNSYPCNEENPVHSFGPVPAVSLRFKIRIASDNNRSMLNVRCYNELIGDR
jgi:hypothetical protein